MSETAPYPWLALLIVAGTGYVLGSLPFGYLVGRAHGIDIFQHGSRNPGATNVRRVLGQRAGAVVLGLDALKGGLAAGWPLLVTGLLPLSAGTSGIAGLFGALLGHSYSCFTRFRGGKGVATGAGGLLVLLPWSALVCIAVWAIVFGLSGYVSLASIVAAAALPVAARLFGAPLSLVVFSALVAVFVIVRHRSNVVRLLNGTENRFRRKRNEDGKASNSP